MRYFDDGEAPEGWARVALSEVVRSKSGNSKLIKGKQKSQPDETCWPAFSASGQDVWVEQWEHEGRAVVVSAVGARCGKAFRADGRWAAVANTHIVLPDERVVDRDFLWHLINNEDYWIRSGTAQPFVKVALSLERLHMLPPLAEQRRIVAKVEALLEQVRRAKDRLDRVPLILKRFRQAVLAAACSGALSVDWRNGRSTAGQIASTDCVDLSGEEPLFDLPTNWRWMGLGKLGRFINGDRSKNYPSKEHRVDKGIPFINAGHLLAGVVDCRSMDYISQERFDLLTSGKVKDGDILYCLRGSLGKCAVIRGIAQGAIASSLLIIRGDSGLCSAGYLLAYLTSTVGELMIRKYDNGSAQPNLSAGDVAKFLVPVPPLEEQVEIVRRVDALFALASTIEQRIERAAMRAGNLTQSILSKAFSGELVPTEADLARTEGREYESAVELLHRVRVTAEAPQAGKPRLRRRTTNT